MAKKAAAVAEVSSAAFLKQVKPTKRKKAKVEEKWVMPMPEATTGKVSNYCRLKVITDDMKKLIDQHEESAKVDLFVLWTQSFWDSKNVPENPHLHVLYGPQSAHPGMTDMRCLQIGKAEFLRFVAHNHHVALQLERVSSERLGRPIFPMFRHSFEER